jgi:ESCRT-II complex subunit VPS36
MELAIRLHHDACGCQRDQLTSSNNKVPQYQDLTVHLTTHRLLITPNIPATSSSNSSMTQGSSKSPSASSIASGLQTSMSNVRQTELYVGFMRSSPKITLSLGRVPISQQAASSSSHSHGETSASGSRGGTNPGSDGVQALTTSSTNSNSNISDNVHASVSGGGGGGGWTCPVCGYVNPLNEYGQVASSEKCGLCGITYGKSASMGPNGRAPVSGSGSGVSSLAPSRSRTPAPAPGPASRPDLLTPSSAQTQDSPNSHSGPGPAEAASVSGQDGKAIACPACTFLNHPSLRNCEICSTALPISKAITSTSTAGTGASGPDVTAAGLGGDAGKLEIVRLSFRKGGVQECYRRLKNVLSDKAWERAEVS